jgi:hypothetical protein
VILAQQEDQNEHHSAFIAAACAKPLASMTTQALPYYETYDPIPLNSNTLPIYRIPFSKAGEKERPW